MTTNWNYRQQGALRQHARAMIAQAESENKPLAVSVVNQGSSGVAVGLYQVDLGKHPDLARDIVAMARREGAFIDPKTGKDDPEKAKRMERLLTQEYGENIRGDRNPALRAESEEAKAWVRSRMERPEILATIERKGEAFIDANIAELQNVCGNAAPQAQAFCNSLQGQTEMVSFMHQSGTGHNRAIRDFVEGRTAAVGRGDNARQVRLENNADVTQFREKIRDNTPFGRNATNRAGLEERDRKADEYYRSHRIDDAVPVLMNPPPAERFRGEGERAQAPAQGDSTQTADAPSEPARNWVVGLEASPTGGTQIVWGTQDDYEAARAKEETAASQQHALDTQGARERSANTASSHAQPVASRVAWRPDPAKLNEAIASVGAQDLPGWAQNLLGRDVMSNGAKKAVMGFQTAINDATRPMPYDYRWSFDKRNGRIDVDGDLGPQTRSGFGRAVDKHGEDGFPKLYATDQFGRYVKAVDHGRAKIEDLEDTVAGTLGQAQQDAAARFQTSLNRFHDDSEEPGERLKIDGWIGPKTTEDFRSTLYRVGPDRLTKRFERDDFWNDEDRA